MATQQQKNTFARNLKHYLSEQNVSQSDLARILDYPETTVSNWAKAANYPRIDKIQEMADFFGVKKSDLIEDKIDRVINTHPDLHPIRRIRKIPILGTIACGSPIWADENIEDYVALDPKYMDGEFALYCKGDSMIDAGIYDGDLVLLKKTPTVENGTIAAVLIDDSATLKRVYKTDTGVILQPCNQRYTPIHLSPDEADAQLLILGELVGHYHVD